MLIIRKMKNGGATPLYDSLDSKISPFGNLQVLASGCNVFSSIKFLMLKKSLSIVRWYVVFQDDTPIMAVPLRLFKRIKTAYILGSLEGFDYVDIAFNPNLPSEVLCEGINLVFQTLSDSGYETLYWSYLDELSDSNSLIKKKSKYSLEKVQNVCVYLHEYNQYDEYIKVLSKHVRQNIRTAYNRAGKDGLNIDCVIYDAKREKLTKAGIKAVLSEYYTVYKTRHSSRYHQKKRFQRQINYAWRALDENNAFMASVKLNGEIGAFLFGFVDDKAVYITRLAINEKYKFYSPGMILVNEVIKYLMDGKKLDLNLLRGTEKYKLDFGGTIYNTLNYTIDLKK